MTKKVNGSLCIDHNNQLKDIWVSIRGNGDPKSGMIFKIETLIERQAHIKRFIDRVDSAFWWVVGSSLVGVMAAIGAFILGLMRLMWEHGKL